MFRRVMHDYSDPVCIDVLKQVVPAMGPDSVVLIADFCFPPRATRADLPIAAMDNCHLQDGWEGALRRWVQANIRNCWTRICYDS